MPDQPNHRIPEEFSGNEWLVDELYEEYKKDKNSVDKKWWSIFESFDESGSSNGRHSSAESSSSGGKSGAQAKDKSAKDKSKGGKNDGGTKATGDGAKSRSATDETGELGANPSTRKLPIVNTEQNTPAASGESDARPGPGGPQQPDTPEGAASKAAPAKPAPKKTTESKEADNKKDSKGDAPIPAQLPKSAPDQKSPDEDKKTPLRGPAKAIASNMDASLSVPTATSVRAVPAKLLIDNRVVINSNLARARGGKVSFTHIIGYAIIRALAQFPSQNVFYEEVDGKPMAVQPAHVNFGLAIDMPKPDGSRLLVVPNIKKAETMNFSEFWNAYEVLVKKARDNKLTAEDHAGTTISLTNPGGIGTVHSVPRLSKGQACIIGVGALEYPAEFQGSSEKKLADQAISKTITLTST